MAKKQAKKKAAGKKRGRKPTLASQADRYALYQQAVQAPDFEVDFFIKAFRREYKRRPTILREDFCGTHAVCCEWVKRRRDHVAIGVDIDPEPLNWGIQHNQSKLTEEQRSRIILQQADVRTSDGPKADVLAAENFSYWVFKTRPELREYFKIARRNLRKEGIMVLDLMGGPETMTENLQDVRRHRGFKYVWDQARLNPINHDCTYHIHFRFPDGSELTKAFTYNWRFWTIPEVREVLLEAGFRRVDVYWEGTDPDTGKGNDIYGIATSAPQDLSWIAYMVAVK